MHAYLSLLVRHAARAHASRIEADMLTGCAACGRRLADAGGRPIHGATLVSHAMPDGQPRAMCGECASEPDTVLAVLDVRDG